MPTYLICDVKVKDCDTLMEYLSLAKGTVERYGGRYLAQAGDISRMEGDWSPQTVVIVEFPSKDAAETWYASTEYADALAVNRKAMDRQMILVEGLEPA